jgi:hypothetical protein
MRVTIKPIRRTDGKLVRPRQPERGLSTLSSFQRKTLKAWLRDSKVTYSIASDRLKNKWGIHASVGGLSEWFWQNCQSVKTLADAGKAGLVLAEIVIKILPGNRVHVVVKKR